MISLLTSWATRRRRTDNHRPGTARSALGGDAGRLEDHRTFALETFSATARCWLTGAGHRTPCERHIDAINEIANYEWQLLRKTSFPVDDYNWLFDDVTVDIDSAMW